MGGGYAPAQQFATRNALTRVDAVQFLRFFPPFVLNRRFQQLWVQLVGIIAVAAWALVHAGVLFWVLNRMFLLRVEQDTELAGLDNTKHAGPAYPYFQMIETA